MKVYQDKEGDLIMIENIMIDHKCNFFWLYRKYMLYTKYLYREYPSLNDRKTKLNKRLKKAYRF